MYCSRVPANNNNQTCGWVNISLNHTYNIAHFNDFIGSILFIFFFFFVLIFILLIQRCIFEETVALVRYFSFSLSVLLFLSLLCMCVCLCELHKEIAWNELIITTDVSTKRDINEPSENYNGYFCFVRSFVIRTYVF